MCKKKEAPKKQKLRARSVIVHFYLLPAQEGKRICVAYWCAKPKKQKADFCAKSKKQENCGRDLLQGVAYWCAKPKMIRKSKNCGRDLWLCTFTSKKIKKPLLTDVQKQNATSEKAKTAGAIYDYALFQQAVAGYAVFSKRCSLQPRGVASYSVLTKRCSLQPP